MVVPSPGHALGGLMEGLRQVVEGGSIYIIFWNFEWFIRPVHPVDMRKAVVCPPLRCVQYITVNVAAADFFSPRSLHCQLYKGHFCSIPDEAKFVLKGDFTKTLFPYVCKVIAILGTSEITFDT